MGRTNYSLLALLFFIFLFGIFLVLKPSITGHAVSFTTEPATGQVTEQPLQGNFTLTLGDATDYSPTTLLEIRLINETLPVVQNITPLTSVPGLSTQPATYTLSLNTFNLRPAQPGTYSLIINITSNGQNIQTATQSITVAGFADVLVATGIDLAQLTPDRIQFQNNDTIACAIQAPKLGTFQLSFYKPGDQLNSPFRTFATNELSCLPDSPDFCYVNLTITETVKGQWACLAKNTYEGKTVSKLARNSLEMINSPPRSTLPASLLLSNASLTLDLAPYFIDLDNDPITYQASGTTIASANVSGTVLTISNPTSAIGNDTLNLLAFDGFDTAEINISLSLEGTGIAPLPEEPLPLPEEPITPAPTPEPLNTATADQQPNLADANLPKITTEKTGLQPLQILLFSFGGLILLGGIGFAIYQLKKKKNPLEQLTPAQPQTLEQQLNQTPQQPVQTSQPVSNPTPVQSPSEPPVQNVTSQTQQEAIQSEQAAQSAPLENQPSAAYLQAKTFAQQKKNQGFTKEQIKQALLAKKWKEETLEQMFTELNII
ncbi:MAG: hypothetical protein WC595_02150 [Candidatus Nanoarchaeia archaeon]